MIRFFDILFSLIGLLILSPLLLVISVLIKITSRGPVLFKQKRVGFSNIDFLVWKFRTMRCNSDNHSMLTIGNRDPRITKIGYYLRKSKLDELPQLINVLFGVMSFVGPRPEVRKFVDFYNIEQQKILTVKPGITDWSSIFYRDESVILYKSNNPEYDYIHLILPDKIRYNLIYINNKRLNEYFIIIFVTIWRIIFPLKNN